MLAVGLFGLYETAVLSLLPVWGLRVGLGDKLAAAVISAIYFGAIALQVPVGWLSDKISRQAAMRLCGIAGLAGAALLPILSSSLPPLFLLLFFWGGLASGIYPVALSIAGERFRGAELIAANAALIVSYGLGSLLGPVLGGAAMDLWNPQGLPVLLALLFAGFLIVTLFRRR